MPNPNFLLTTGIVLGTVGLVALAASVRYEITLTILALYLGLADGVVKLETANQLVSSLRDIMIAAICAGAVVRMVVRREKIRLPPLSGWVIAFVVLTLVEAFNPNTHGMLKVLGGFRQQFEWIPFFFFGYLLMRSKERFRKFFLILGVIALANGVVSTVQTQLTPAQISKWGPGYAKLINGTGSVSGRVYTDSEGTVRVRPTALGSDLGFGGFVGVVALPGLLALLGTGRLRRRWAVALLCLGALLAVATSLQREAVLGAVIAAAAFVVLSASAGRRATRVLVGILAIGTLAFGAASVLAPDAGKGVFSRYGSIAPGKAATTSIDYREKDLSQIPTDINNYPFGAGLATAGAARSFGGGPTATIEGHQLASAESQYNYVTLELGLPGLLLWVALSGMLIVLVVRRLRWISDVELRLDLAGMFAVIIAFTVMGFVGPTMSNLPYGPYFWFAVGVAAYWFAGGERHGGQLLQRRSRTIGIGAGKPTLWPTTLTRRRPAKGMVSLPGGDTAVKPVSRAPRRLGSIVARLTSANALVMAFSLMTGPLLARSLGPSGRGAVAAVAAPLSLVPYILCIGLPTFVVREAARERPTGELLGSVGLIYLVIGLAAIGFSHPAAEYFAQGRAPVRTALLITFYAMPVLLLGTLFLGIANGQQRWRMVIGARLTPAVIGLASTVVLFIFGLLTVTSAIVILLVGAFASMVPTLGVLRGARPLRVRRSLIRESFHFGLPSWLWQISSTTNARLDQVLMVSLTSSSQLGLYAVAVSLASVSNVFASALGPALLPRVTKGDNEIVGRACCVTLSVASAINLALALSCPIVLPLLFGAKFHGAVPMSWILIAAAIPSAGTQVLTASLMSAGRPRFVAASEMVAVTVTVGGLLLLVTPLGGVGAALVSFAAYTLTFFVLLAAARREFHLPLRAFLIPTAKDLKSQIGLIKQALLRMRSKAPV